MPGYEGPLTGGWGIMTAAAVWAVVAAHVVEVLRRPAVARQVGRDRR